MPSSQSRIFQCLVRGMTHDEMLSTSLDPAWSTRSRAAPRHSCSQLGVSPPQHEGTTLAHALRDNCAKSATTIRFLFYLGVPKPGCFKPGCLFCVEALFCALLRPFALFFALLRPTAFRTTASGNYRKTRIKL